MMKIKKIFNNIIWIQFNTGTKIQKNNSHTNMHTNQQISQLLQQIDLKKFNNNYQEACLFYFGLLRQLDMKIITTQVQIENIGIAYQRNKKEFNKLQSIPTPKNKQQINIRNTQRVDQDFQYECKFRGCNKGFDKKSSLQFHEMLKHKIQPQQWHNNRIFNIEIKQLSQNSKKGR